MNDQQTWATTDTKVSAPEPNAYVQWNGTDVCVELNCECGYHGHYDGDFAYGLRCGACGRTWIMPHTFGLVPGEYDDEVTQDATTPPGGPHRIEGAAPRYVEVQDGLGRS